MTYRTLVALFDGNHQYAPLLIDEFFIRQLQKNLLHQKLVLFLVKPVWSLRLSFITQV